VGARRQLGAALLEAAGRVHAPEGVGDLTFDLEDAALTDAYRSTQSGWYVQGVYQFRPRWRAGLRYDALDSGETGIGLVPPAF
jgi:hypothetical protein